MSTDPLSIILAALANPTRRAILAHLAQGEAAVTELSQPFEMSLPAISKHLKVLRTSRIDYAQSKGLVATLPIRGRTP